MNRFLHHANTLGVLVLVVLCVLQWRSNRNSRLEVLRLDKSRHEHLATLEVQQKKLEGCSADLNQFRDQVARNSAAVNELRTDLKKAERDVTQLTSERDQLRASVTNWSEAVAVRDARLQELSQQLKTLADDRNQAVRQFNEIAGKYNSVVQDLAIRANEYNALVEKYNAAIKASTQAAAR